jgi:hypothetical protein
VLVPSPALSLTTTDGGRLYSRVPSVRVSDQPNVRPSYHGLAHGGHDGPAQAPDRLAEPRALPPAQSIPTQRRPDSLGREGVFPTPPRVRPAADLGAAPSLSRQWSVPAERRRSACWRHPLPAQHFRFQTRARWCGAPLPPVVEPARAVGRRGTTRLAAPQTVRHG